VVQTSRVAAGFGGLKNTARVELERVGINSHSKGSDFSQNLGNFVFVAGNIVEAESLIATFDWSNLQESSYPS